ncbi:MAG: polysaccharide deacetylase family protein [Terrimicrobiaceae bacterium]|nr:polysaccharide deacetylase family protein [Terrimicrobiaceae bacterium]
MQISSKNRSPQARGLVVSIHDVSPRTREAAMRMLADLSALGVERVSLLVIPDHHRRGHFLNDAEFCGWLTACVRLGHEAVVHGYYHLREATGGEGAWKRVVTQSYTAGEGEFYDLGEAEAFDRVTRALEEFRSAGLQPAGFVAPAWLLGAEAERAVARAGFQYTTRIGCVTDLARGGVHVSQSLVYSTRAAWRRAVSLAWNSALLRALGDRPLLRVGLHPPDWQFPAVRDHARKCLTRALASREAMTYEDWLARQRALADSSP